MKYYRVKEWCDGHEFYKWDNRKYGYVRQTGKYMVANELLTEREFWKYSNHKGHYEIVEIPKSRVYWSFGVRFEKKEGV